jgi:hypothetical protein
MTVLVTSITVIGIVTMTPIVNMEGLATLEFLVFFPSNKQIIT